jgi:hypothetical protein
VKSSFFGHCGIGEAFGDYVTDGDADTVHTVWLATAGSMATSIGMILVARVAITPLMLAALFAVPTLGTAMGARAVASDDVAGGVIILFFSLGLLLAGCVLVSPVREAARVLTDAAKIVTSSPLIILVSIFGTFVRGAIITAGTYGSLAILWPAVTLGEADNFLDRKIEITEGSPVYWAAGGGFVTIWLACTTAHLVDLGFAVFTIGRIRGDQEQPSLGSSLATAVSRYGATAATGAFVVSITYTLVVVLRYVQRRIKEIPGTGLAPIACCQCAWTAAAALSRVVLPVVYSSSALYDTTLLGGMRWSLKLIASCPVLFATTLAASALFSSLQVVASITSAVAIVTITMEKTRLNAVVLAVLGARLAAWLVVSPYQGCVHASLVTRCAIQNRAASEPIDNKKESEDLKP